jgi:hypothetical protein
MAPRGRNTATARLANLASSNPTPDEGIQNPTSEPVSTPSQTVPQISPGPENATASSAGSSTSKRSKRSNRSKGNSKLQDQLRAQAQELAELRTLLTRQMEHSQPPPISERARGKLPQRNTPYMESDRPLESVEDIGRGREPHFVSPHLDTRQSATNFRVSPRRSESDRPRNLSTAPPLTRLSTAATSDYDPRWKPKATTPAELDDGVEPTWITWRIGMDNKFEEDAPQFRSELSRIRYVFGRTKGKANKLLRPYMRDRCPTPFTTVQDMYSVLEELYTDPGEVEEAREDFRDLYMSRTQSFAEFKMEFLQLAGLATISRTEYVDELYNKLTDKLKDALAPAKYKWGRDFALASLEIQQTDTRFALNTKQRQRVRISSTTSASTTGTRGTLPKPSDIDRTELTSAMSRTTPRPWSAKPLEQPKISPAKAIESRHSTPRPTTSVSTLKCYNCGKFGHTSKYCDQPMQQGVIQEIEEEEEEPLEEDTTDNVDDDLSGKEHA